MILARAQLVVADGACACRLGPLLPYNGDESNWLAAGKSVVT
jgi:hypothetical protein